MIKLYCEMTDKELQQVDLIDFTGLNVGDKVTHKNAGGSGGSSGKIYEGQGTVMGHTMQGLYAWGGLCVTVDVAWNNGERYELGYSLAKKV